MYINIHNIIGINILPTLMSFGRFVGFSKITTREGPQIIQKRLT